MSAPACECRGVGTRGVPCERQRAQWVSRCEALLCEMCVSCRRCCACGAWGTDHYRLLVDAKAVAS